MTTRLDEAVALLRTLPEDEQERAAGVLIAFAQDRTSYKLTDEQIVGIDHAMRQADRGELARDDEIVALFGERL
jgi:hypothetical protein